MIRVDELEGSNRVFKQPNKSQRHVNLANSMRLEPNFTPCLEDSMSVHPLSMPTCTCKEELRRSYGHPLKMGS